MCCTGAKAVLDKLFCIQDSLLQVRSLPLAEREPARINVHLCDTDESQRGREAQARGHRAFTQQVRQLVPLLEAKGGVVEHPAMQVARLLDLKLVDVAPEAHELPCQLLVLQAHVGLQRRTQRDTKIESCLNHLLIN